MLSDQPDAGTTTERPNPWWRAPQITYLYLARFPVLLAMFLLAYVQVARVWVPQMFRSTLVHSGSYGLIGLVFTSSSAWLAAVTVLATLRAVCLHGPERFNVPSPWSDPQLRLRDTVVFLGAAALLVGVVAFLSAGEGQLGWIAWLSALVGLGFAVLAAVSAVAVQAWLTPPGDGSSPMPAFVIPTHYQWVARLRGRPSPLTPWMPMLRRFFLRYARILGPGYLDAEGNILPGHAFSTGLLVVSGCVYLAGFVVAYPSFAISEYVPALFLILVLATSVTWLLAGVAFFLDFHRLPVLLTFVIVVGVFATFSYSDHYFRLRTPVPGAIERLQDPYTIVMNPRRTHPLITVIAVDGGGIQAAAWGAEVLSRLYEAWPEFQQSVRLISSISGGSVGTMYFVDALGPDRSTVMGKLETVRRFAQRPSLSAAAWGLTYPDLFRAIVPIPRFTPRFERDRGWALERAWERGWHGEEDPPLLSSWIAGVHDGWRPATAFNATDVEAGTRFVFGTFKRPDEWSKYLPTVYPDYNGRDVRVATAARLSAAFTYVSPIPTALPEDTDDNGTPRRHFADGGYYDNYGIVTALQWLDDVLRTMQQHNSAASVAVIKVRSSPPAAGGDPAKERQWGYQAIAPFVALMSVRTAGQRERGEGEFLAVERFWDVQKGGENTFDVRDFSFVFCGEHPPLSWQLSGQERTAISTQWTNPHNTQELGKLLAFANAVRDGHDPGQDAAETTGPCQ